MGLVSERCVLLSRTLRPTLTLSLSLSLFQCVIRRQTTTIVRKRTRKIKTKRKRKKEKEKETLTLWKSETTHHDFVTQTPPSTTTHLQKIP